MANKKLVVFDTETTGLNPDEDGMVQFSACDFNGQVLLNTYIRPTKHTEWPEAEKINHISPETVKDAPVLADVADKIKMIMTSADYLVAYNIDFDLGFLAPVFHAERRQKQIDVMLDFARFFGEIHDYYGDYKWQKLITAAAYYGFDFAAHDSMQDVFATLHIYKQMRIDDRRKLAATRISRLGNTYRFYNTDKQFIADCLAGRDPGSCSANGGLFDEIED